jgi:hypothetical protein
MIRRALQDNAAPSAESADNLPAVAVGKAPLALVVEIAGKMVAVVTTFTTHTTRLPTRKRLTGKSSLRLASETLAHLRATVLPHADQVAESLGVPPLGLELSVTKPAATRVHELDAVVSGTSLDVSAWLAVLSLYLALPLSQDTVCTGAIEPTGDDLHPVQGLIEKLAAVRAMPSIRRFVCPPMDEDQSIGQLAPLLRQRTAEALQEAARDIELVTARSLADVLRTCATEDGMVTAALCCGYFDQRLGDGIPPSAHDSVIRILTERLEERFWECLKANLHAGRTSAARALLRHRADYQIRVGRYPPQLGVDLANLVRSLPPTIRRRQAFFPLIPARLCFQLGQLAEAAQERDAITLTITASGRLPLVDSHRPARRKARPSRDAVERHLQAVISAIGADTLAREIGLPIDEVRLSYPVPSVIIEDRELFQDACTSFFVALTERLDVTTPTEFQTDDANTLLAEAFAQEGGIDAAWEEARFALRGGMRFILDRISDTYKHKLQAARVKRVLEQQLNQLDWTDRRALMACLLDRLGGHLPSELRGMDPARLVKHCDQVAWAYVSAMDRTVAMFRRY